jgi:dihydroorotase-like cyclic amidohydrolase
MPGKYSDSELPVINTNEKACLTLYSPEGKTSMETADFYSRSVNSPFVGKELNGAVYGTLQQDKIFIRTKMKLNGNR